MGTEFVVFIVVLLLLVLLAVETPVAFALGASGTVGLLLLDGPTRALSSLGAIPYSATATFSLVVIPMFILMGALAVHGLIAEQVFTIANRALRRLPGGLGMATVAACAGFAAVSGSSVATAATFARMSITEMRRYGYSDPFAAGIVAAAGTLGALIPPSVLLVFYGIIARESIGKLLIAGITPGIVSALLYMMLIAVRATKNIDTAKAGPTVIAGGSGEQPASEATQSHHHPERGTHPEPVAASAPAKLPYRGVIRVLILFGIVVGGVYTGTFTASESGALGAAAALVMLVVELRKRGARTIRRALASAIRETASITSMAFAILVGAGLFTFFLSSAGVVHQFTAWVLELQVPPAVIVALLLCMLVPLGMALESFSIIAITVPLFHPVITGLGFDGIWLGIMVIKMTELGLITPPVGVNVFVVVGSTPGLRMEDGFRGILPFAGVDIATIALFFVFPGIVLWLPSVAPI